MENFRLIFISILFVNFLHGIEYSFIGGIVKSDEVISTSEIELIENSYLEAKNIIEDLFKLKFKNEKVEIVFLSSTYEFTKNFGVDYKIGGISTRNNVYFQPIRVLRTKSDLRKIFLHEFLHFWIDKIGNLPDFINEGIALYYSKLFNKNTTLIFPEGLEDKEIFTEDYYFSSKEFVRYLIEKKLLHSVLSNSNYVEVYRKFYFENADKIRVLVNPRKERELSVKLSSGYATIFSKDGEFEVKNSQFKILMEGKRIFVLGREVFSIHFKTDKFILNDRSYRGELLITNELAINILPVEYYVYSVVNSEIPPSELEAMKVQAVLSRTLAYYFIKSRKNEPYDVNSLTDSQSYRGMSEENEQSKRCIIDTEGEILTFAGSIIPVYFSSTCGGKTANSEDVWNDYLPFYRSKDCFYNGETNCNISEHFKEWERFLTNDFLYSIGITNVEFVYSGERVKRVIVDGRIESFDVFKARISKILGWNFLKSNFLTIEKKENGYLIKGRGLGHGVGVCQYGAIGLAKKGKNYREILSFYLSGVEIEKFKNQNPWGF